MRKNYRNSGKSTSCVNTLKNGYNRTFYVTYIYHDLKKKKTSQVIIELYASQEHWKPERAGK